MKTTRHKAIEMFKVLAKANLGHMDADTMSATLDDFDKLRQVHSEYIGLADEVSRRLYADLEQETKKSYFVDLAKYEHESDGMKKAELKAIMENTYPDIWPRYSKHLDILAQLYNREIDIVITEVDRSAFVRGMMLGNPGLTAHRIESVFAPLFVQSSLSQNYDELDELL